MPRSPPARQPGVDAATYDATTKFLHWVTAALIITQFGLGELWDVCTRRRCLVPPLRNPRRGASAHAAGQPSELCAAVT